MPATHTIPSALPTSRLDGADQAYGALKAELDGCERVPGDRFCEAIWRVPVPQRLTDHHHHHHHAFREAA